MHLLLLLAPLVFADPAPAIRLPDLKPIPQPMPGPDTVAKLSPATLYVVDGDTDYLLLASPKGIVTTVTEAGPLKVRGQFADGAGKVETRTFRGKTVTFVEAAHSGRVELLIVPKGAATETDVIRRTLDVDAGEGPIPPPVPPGPGPKPDPTPKGKAAAFMLIEETGNADAARGRLLGDPKFFRFVKDNKIVARIIDKDAVDKDGNPPADAVPYLNRVKDKAARLPVLFVVDAAGGILYEGDAPTDPAALLKLLGG